MARTEPGSRWGIALVAFVVLDVSLVTMAVHDGGASSPTAAVTRMTPSPSATSTAESGSTPSPTPSPATTPTSVPTPSPSATATTPVPVRRRLAAVDGSHAWRASTGSCAGGGARVWLSTDRGRTWTARSAPSASISRLVVGSGSDAVIAVGADTTCATTLRRSSDNGRTWSDAEGVGRYFHLDPSAPGSVAVPGRGSARACGGRRVLDLAVRNGRVQVLCPDGRLRSIGDGGRSWTDSVRISGAVALATSPVGAGRTYVARLGQRACVGVQIVDTGRIGDPVACVPRRGAVEPGSVSLSITGTVGWLLVGDAVYTSGNLADWVER